MSRIRTIKPEQPKDEGLAALSIPTRYLFAFLPCLADRKGRLEDRPRVIKLEIFPWDEVDVDKILADLSPKFILRYESAGKRYIQIKTFEKHQRPHPKEADSIIPSPSKEDFSREKVCTSREKVCASKVDSGKESLTMDNGKEIPPTPDGVLLAEKLKAMILANNPKAKTPSNLNAWAKTADLMLSVDRRTRQEIEAVMSFSQNSAFWKSNILSMDKLRSKFDTLYLQDKNQNGISQKSNRAVNPHAGYSAPTPGKFAHLTEGQKTD